MGTERIVAGEKLRLLNLHCRNGVMLTPGTELVFTDLAEADRLVARGMALSLGVVYDDPPKRKKTPAAPAEPQPTNEV